MKIITKAQALVFIWNLIIGWLAASIALGTVLGVNGLTIVLLLAAIIWVLRVWAREDAAFAGAGLAVGFIAVVIARQIGYPGDLGIALLFLLLYTDKA